ncbi:macrophage mannose receptor 1 isoform X2 [Hydra vulgaris]|uniref:macrophage mannose receptor 1 isoform X2 n=2 Tax=Hydra vulgaris TaxID=6087 RepID=UPI001F5FEDA6|nr:macrophage mannose receptor 1-like isoform X2 [Hydra vulgaris]
MNHTMISEEVSIALMNHHFTLRKTIRKMSAIIFVLQKLIFYYLFSCLTTTTVTTPAQASTNKVFDGTCPKDWINYGNYCYFFYSINVTQPGKDWLDSLLWCLNNGGNLLSVADQAENVFIVDNLNNEKMKNQHFWIGLNAHQRVFVWSDKTASLFSNWRQGQPDNLLGRESCVETNSSGWNDHVCDSKFGFICKIKKEIFGTDCLNESYEYGSYCYFFYGNVAHEGVDWHSALYLCKNMGGNLLSVTDQAENLFILNHLKNESLKNQYFWIGLNAIKRTFAWTDNTAPLFINWKNSEPDNFGGDELCSEITTNGWNDISCDNHFGFICKTKQGLPLSGYGKKIYDGHKSTALTAATKDMISCWFLRRFCKLYYDEELCFVVDYSCPKFQTRTSTTTTISSTRTDPTTTTANSTTTTTDSTTATSGSTTFTSDSTTTTAESTTATTDSTTTTAESTTTTTDSTTTSADSTTTTTDSTTATSDSTIATSDSITTTTESTTTTTDSTTTTAESTTTTTDSTTATSDSTTTAAESTTTTTDSTTTTETA